MEGVPLIIATQMISSSISGFSSVGSDTAADQDICDKIVQTNKQVDQMTSLLETLEKASEIETDTRQLILELNDRLGAEKARMQQEMKKFSIKVMIAIIMNIVIVTIIFLKLFS
jgi:hypothetical protein